MIIILLNTHMLPMLQITSNVMYVDRNYWENLILSNSDHSKKEEELSEFV